MKPFVQMPVCTFFMALPTNGTGWEETASPPLPSAPEQHAGGCCKEEILLQCSLSRRMPKERMTETNTLKRSIPFVLSYSV